RRSQVRDSDHLRTVKQRIYAGQTKYMSLGACRDGTEQAHSIAGELLVHFLPKFAGFPVPFHLPDDACEVDGIRQSLDQSREAQRKKEATIGQEFQALHSYPQKTVGESIRGLAAIEVLQQFVAGNVPDNADVRASRSRRTVL